MFAAAGVPVTFVTMPTLGTTAPATRAGAFAVGAAELVSATVLVQLAYPGAPVAHSIMQSYADPRTGGFVSFPLDGRCRFLATELAHHWGVPSEAACCGTDAKQAGAWQAGVEDAGDLVQAAWEGSDLMPSIGLLDVYTVFDPADLLLADDVYHRARYAIMDLDLDDEALALDAVREVGPGGHYLGSKHTRKHLRTSFVPAITHQPAPGGGFRDPLEVARERAAWIDANHVPRAAARRPEGRAHPHSGGGRRRAPVGAGLSGHPCGASTARRCGGTDPYPAHGAGRPEWVGSGFLEPYPRQS